MTYAVGGILLLLTVRAWYKNIRLMMKGNRTYTPTDKLLNYPLLFLWLSFMTVFSIGIMVNN
jgi:hypothetical protein